MRCGCMSDAHDLHVLHDLIAAVRATPGAPDEAAVELEAQLSASAGSDIATTRPSMIETAREVLGGLVSGLRPEPIGQDGEGDVQTFSALLARMEAAIGDDRISGPARDAVLRAFDPVKAARDAALQRDAAG